MKILKGYIKNLHCPKAFVVERYIVEEAIEFFMSTSKRQNLLGFWSLGMTKEWEVRVQEDCMLSLQV